MWHAILAIISTLIIYIMFKLVDNYYPVKSGKKATLIRKHTEQGFSTTVDYSGVGYNVAHARYLITVNYCNNLQTEEVSVDVYSKAKIGQELDIIKVSGRFSKKLIRYSFVV